MKRELIMKLVAVLTVSTVMASNSLMPIQNTYAETIVEIGEQEYYVNNVSNVGYTEIGGVESYSQDDNIVLLKMITGEQVRVSLLENNVFRLYMDPTGKFQDDPTPNGADHITTIREKEDEEYTGVTAKV